MKDSTRSGELAGTEAARCAEQALLEAARFAPGKAEDIVPIAIELDPP